MNDCSGNPLAPLRMLESGTRLDDASVAQAIFTCAGNFADY